MKNNYFDVLVIGSGIAGLSAAIAASEKGVSVAVLSKESDITNCNTNHAQGGIVAEAEGDSAEALIKDIKSAGDYLNNEAAVEYLTREGAPLIEPFLAQKIGVAFCRNEDGDYDMTREGNHSFRRIMHVKDYSGAAIEEALSKYVKTISNIRIFTNITALDLITNSRHSKDCQQRYKTTRVIGAYCLNESSGKVEKVFASSIILATGGVGKLFTFTSNSAGATGDGLALAERVGAEIVNSEYVQFHPTVLFNRDIKDFLITEAMRGEGAKLRNRKGEYFMKRYSPKLMDLAPRDEVARAIYQEMENDDAGYVWLDARDIKHVKLDERFPKIFDKCLSVGIDIRKDLIPVVPAAHYFCGGIKVDLNGKTSVKGLWAAGEVACTGVHGANRLASNSLLEAVVFSEAIISAILKEKVKPTKQKILTTTKKIRTATAPQRTKLMRIRRTIKRVMWDNVGIVRTPASLARAIELLQKCAKELATIQTYNELALETSSMVTVATAVTKAAQQRKKSLGCHFMAEA